MSALTDSGSRVIEDAPIVQNEFNEMLDDDLVQLHRENAWLARQEHDQDPHGEKLDQYYQISQTADLLHRYSAVNALRNVALQFPDHLLGDAANVVQRMKQELTQRISVSGDKMQSTDSSPSISEENNVPVGDIEDFMREGATSGEITQSAQEQQQQHALYLTSEDKERSTSKVKPLALQNGIPDIYVLGDTSYSSCCVDEIAAQHAGADFIVHYGTACLQRVRRTPVHHVFGTSYSIDADQCAASLLQYVQSGTDGELVVVLFDLIYHRIVEDLRQTMADNEHIVFSRLNPLRVTQNVDYAALGMELQEDGAATATITSHSHVTHEINGLRFEIPFQNGEESDGREERPFKFFYIGEDSIRLTQLMMDHSTTQCGRFSGVTNTFDDGSFASSRVKRLLKKRYYLVHKAMEAQVFGILVATVSVNNYMEILKYSQELIKARGKKAYVFYVGKLNIPKLANFAEVDSFVLISCNQNSLIDSKEFYKPIITPFELELALKRGKQWTGRFITDFNKLLSIRDQSAEQGELEEESDEESEVDYSFISGTIRYKQGNVTYSSGTRIQSTDSNALVRSIGDDDQQMAVVSDQSPAMKFLNERRSFRGLEQKLGETPVVDMVDGRSGIAKGYTHEQVNDSTK